MEEVNQTKEGTTARLSAKGIQLLEYLMKKIYVFHAPFAENEAFDDFSLYEDICNNISYLNLKKFRDNG